MTKLEIRCPSCSKRGNIDVSEEDVKNTTRGLYAVNITQGIICEHSFVAYVDKNLSVRDSYMADFQIEIPGTFLDQQIEEQAITPAEGIDVSLIKLNLTASLLAYLIKAILYKKPIALIFELDYMYEDIINFFQYLTQNSFGVDISVLPKADYNPIEYEKHIVFWNREVLKDEQNIIDPKKLRGERTIVQKFLNEYDTISSLNILKNEIQKAYKLSKSIAEIVVKIKKKEKVYSKKLIDDLEKIHNIKIQMPYLDFLIEIVENYFGVEVPLTSNISDFLGIL